MLRISWTEHATNEEVLRETKASKKMLITTKKDKAEISGAHNQERMLGEFNTQGYSEDNNDRKK